MPTVTFNIDMLQKDLEVDISTEDLSEAITSLGTEVEGVEDDKITVEVFPNRPDYLSRTGLIYGLQGWFDTKKGLPEIEVKDAQKKVIVEDTVSDVRPITHCFIVKDIELSEALLNELITVQEKLHITYGRGRKKCAIGLYDNDKLHWPIRYTAKKPENILFTPLGDETARKGDEILQQHKKGKEYKHLLEDHDTYPLFIDSSDTVLSMPPIINSHDVGAISTETTNIFVECSGHKHEDIKPVIAILAHHFTHIGGTVEAVSIEGAYEKETPDLEPSTIQLSTDHVEKRIGTEITQDEIVKYLEKSRASAKAENKDIINVINAPYRKDILHYTDCIEDIAIQIGYNTLEPDRDYTYSESKQNKNRSIENQVRSFCIGQGLEEVYTFNLVNKEEADKIHSKPNIELKNSVSEQYNSLRSGLLYSLLSVLERNTESTYPQNIFEVGTVFYEDESAETGITEVEMLGAAFCQKSNQITNIIELLAQAEKEFGISIDFEEIEREGFIEGRTAQIINVINGEAVFGEIHPKIINQIGVSLPITYMQLPMSLFN